MEKQPIEARNEAFSQAEFEDLDDQEGDTEDSENINKAVNDKTASSADLGPETTPAGKHQISGDKLTDSNVDDLINNAVRP